MEEVGNGEEVEEDASVEEVTRRNVAFTGETRLGRRGVWFQARKQPPTLQRDQNRPLTCMIPSHNGY